MPNAAIIRLLAASAALALPGLALGHAPLPLAAESVAEAERAQSQPEQDAALRRVAEALVGTWATSGPVPGVDGAEPSGLLLSIALVEIEGLGVALYAETARESDPAAPVRQAVFSLIEVRGEVRLRTHEFGSGVPKGMLVGLFAAPDAFPPVRASQLVPTLDVPLDVEGENFNGQTEHRFPTTLGGAVEMTSGIELEGDRLLLAERGYDAEGNVVWGPAEGEHLTLERAESPASASRLEGGVVAIDFAGEDAERVELPAEVVALYSGWTLDRGLFDSSFLEGRNNQPFQVVVPGRLIQGWNVGLAGAPVGGTRRLVIPPAMGYQQGNPQAGIGADDNMYFTVEVLRAEPFEAPALPTPPPGREQR